MPKLKKDFDAVPDGEIYPVTLPAFSACPPELVPQAAELGLLETAEETAAREADESEAAKAAAKAGKGKDAG